MIKKADTACGEMSEIHYPQASKMCVYVSYMNQIIFVNRNIYIYNSSKQGYIYSVWLLTNKSLLFVIVNEINKNNNSY